MRISAVILFILLLAVPTARSAPSPPPKMRPYTGIGILMLPVAGSDQNDPLPLYEDPGLSRLGNLKPGRIPRYDWIFGAESSAKPLIVTGRKGPWLRVAFDDAGREAWLNPIRPATFQSWDLFLKAHLSRLLPGLQKKYYLLYQDPGQTVLDQLAARRLFKVLRLENDWALVMPDQNTLGWLRWRDEDGRLLIGVFSAAEVMQP